MHIMTKANAWLTLENVSVKKRMRDSWCASMKLKLELELEQFSSLGWNLLHEAKLRARAVYVFDIGLTFDLTSLIPCKNHSFRKVLQLWCYLLYWKRKDKIVIIKWLIRQKNKALNSFTQKVELEKGKIYSIKHSRFLLKLS